MATDAEVYEEIAELFKQRFYSDATIRPYVTKIYYGQLTDAEMQIVTKRTASIMAQIFGEKIPLADLDGADLSGICANVIQPALKNSCELIGDIAERFQQGINNEYGIKLKPVRVGADTDRISNLVEKIQEYENPADAKWLIEEPIIDNIMQSVTDNAKRVNAETQQKAGYNVRVKRIYHRNGKGYCRYCANLQYAGSLEGIPDGFWTRHKNCDCMIMYAADGNNYEEVMNYR